MTCPEWAKKEADRFITIRSASFLFVPLKESEEQITLVCHISLLI